MKIKASCRQDEKAVKTMAYMEIYGVKKPVRRLILRSVLSAVLLALLLLEIWLLGWNLPVVVLMALLALACFMEYWWYFVTPKRRYQALGKKQNKERSFVFRNDAVDVDDRLTISYEDLYRVAETKDYIVLFRSRKKVLMVEKSTVTGGTPEQLCAKLQNILDYRYIICKY